MVAGVVALGLPRDSSCLRPTVPAGRPGRGGGVNAVRDGLKPMSLCLIGLQARLGGHGARLQEVGGETREARRGAPGVFGVRAGGSGLGGCNACLIGT